MRNILIKEFGDDLLPKAIDLGEGIQVTVDAATPDNSTIIEIFARQGKLKAGQKQKLAKDILKLAMLKQSSPKPRVLLAFANPSIADHLTRNAWISKARELFGIETRNLFDILDKSLKKEILSAQEAQGKRFRNRSKKLK